MTLSEHEYFIAACSDIACEKLDVQAVAAAYEVAESAEDFFWAVQAAVKLKEICDGSV